MNTFKDFIAIHKDNFEAIKKVLELLPIKIVCRHDMLSIFFAYISTIGHRKIFIFDLLTKKRNINPSIFKFHFKHIDGLRADGLNIAKAIV